MLDKSQSESFFALKSTIVLPHMCVTNSGTNTEKAVSVGYTFVM